MKRSQYTVGNVSSLILLDGGLTRELDTFHNGGEP